MFPATRRVSPLSSPNRSPSLPEPRSTRSTAVLTRSTRSLTYTLALVDVSRFQPPWLTTRPPSPSIQASRPSFTALGPSARHVLLDLHLVVNYRLRAPHLHTTSQETCTHSFRHGRVSNRLNLFVDHVDQSLITQKRTHKGTCQPCVRNLPLDECIVNTTTQIA